MHWRAILGSTLLLTGIAAVAGFDRYLLQSNGGFASSAAGPIRQTDGVAAAMPADGARIRDDMSGLFRRLDAARIVPAADTRPAAVASPAKIPAPAAAPVATSSAAPRREDRREEMPRRETRPGMPTSLLPTSLQGGAAPSSGQGRVMDPRALAALNSLPAPGAPRTMLQPSLAAGDVPPAPAPVYDAVPGKPESEMTADELNARELRRITQ